MASLIDGGGNVSRPSLGRIWSAWYSGRSERWHWSMRRRLINVCRLLKQQAEVQPLNAGSELASRSPLQATLLGSKIIQLKSFWRKCLTENCFRPPATTILRLCWTVVSVTTIFQDGSDYIMLKCVSQSNQLWPLAGWLLTKSRWWPLLNNTFDAI